MSALATPASPTSDAESPMSSSQIALLGAIAGFTIYLGLPIGRLRRPTPRLKAGLNATAIGILIFLVWDVLSHAWEPVDGALGGHHWGSVAANGLVLVLGLTVGLARPRPLRRVDRTPPQGRRARRIGRTRRRLGRRARAHLPQPGR
ncbi:hypothetical protein GCM10020000_75880 [Streptomyces olivoverticillatus]